MRPPFRPPPPPQPPPHPPPPPPPPSPRPKSHGYLVRRLDEAVTAQNLTQILAHDTLAFRRAADREGDVLEGQLRLLRVHLVVPQLHRVVVDVVVRQQGRDVEGACAPDQHGRMHAQGQGRPRGSTPHSSHSEGGQDRGPATAKAGQVSVAARFRGLRMQDRGAFEVSNKSACSRNRVFAPECPLPLRVPSPFRVVQLPSFSFSRVHGASARSRASRSDRLLSTRKTMVPNSKKSSLRGFHAQIPCAGSMRARERVSGGEDDEV